jgi:DNA modification methylase
MQEGKRSALIYRADSRSMAELAAESVALVVTSPPYWRIKDYGEPGQIGHGQTLHEYLRDLLTVWRECFRVGRGGSRLCVNIGDQFARASEYGRYRIIPLHAEIICQCAACGYDYLGSIVWRKKTTMNTSGGAVVMGSYPYPPNGIVEIDFEYILLFKKPGKAPPVPAALRAAAAMTRSEWKEWFSGHWNVEGARKKGHEAAFPEEIPRRLVRMFSLPGDTVLDPFLGTGTTALVAAALGREAVGYEISADYVSLAEARAQEAGIMVDVRTRTPLSAPAAGQLAAGPPADAWTPRVAEMAFPAGAPAQRSAPRPAPELHTVTAVADDCSLTLDSGARVGLSGIHVTDAPGAAAYLRQRVLKKKVFLRDAVPSAGGGVIARVILKNRISVNAHLVKSGMALEETAR